MAARITCPFCERRLAVSDGSGVVACDGCEHRFNTGKLRYKPASLVRQVVGSFLVVAGTLGLLVWLLLFLVVVMAIVGSPRTDSSRPSEVTSLFVVMCIPPAVVVAIGLAMQSGRMVLDAPLELAAPELDWAV